MVSMGNYDGGWGSSNAQAYARSGETDRAVIDAACRALVGQRLPGADSFGAVLLGAG